MLFTSQAPSILIKNASLRFGQVLLFDQLNFNLPAGQCTCLLGQSGIGKTSLLRMLAGLDSQHLVQGDVYTSDTLALKGRIAYMAQTDLLLPWLSIRKNILLGLALRGQKVTKEDQNKVKSLLIEMHLIEVIDSLPKSLSGGMRQRAALARTLIENKPVVVMDEPFASVDTITRLQLQELTARLLKQKTVLLVTHDPLEALRLGHRIHVMSGRPAKLDEPLELSGEPPRDLGDPELLIAQAELLRRLSKAKEMQ